MKVQARSKLSRRLTHIRTLTYVNIVHRQDLQQSDDTRSLGKIAGKRIKNQVQRMDHITQRRKIKQLSTMYSIYSI